MISSKYAEKSTNDREAQIKIYQYQRSKDENLERAEKKSSTENLMRLPEQYLELSNVF
jgi:hypothetical protein